MTPPLGKMGCSYFLFHSDQYRIVSQQGLQGVHGFLGYKEKKESGIITHFLTKAQAH